jgi:hypothetical protein
MAERHPSGPDGTPNRSLLASGNRGTLQITPLFGEVHTKKPRREPKSACRAALLFCCII